MIAGMFISPMAVRDDDVRAVNLSNLRWAEELHGYWARREDNPNPKGWDEDWVLAYQAIIDDLKGLTPVVEPPDMRTRWERGMYD